MEQKKNKDKLVSKQKKQQETEKKSELSRKEAFLKDLKDVKVVMPKWLEFNTEKLTGKINAMPQRDDIDLNIREHLIVELYSK